VRWPGSADTHDSPRSRTHRRASLGHGGVSNGLVRIKNWERYGLKSWIEAAKRRLHHNVLAIALANKLARISWAVLAKGRAFELTRTDDARVQPA
jgi:hypothetical protein